jgi:hypothetical protein
MEPDNIWQKYTQSFIAEYETMNARNIGLPPLNFGNVVSVIEKVVNISHEETVTWDDMMKQKE